MNRKHNLAIRFHLSGYVKLCICFNELFFNKQIYLLNKIVVNIKIKEPLVNILNLIFSVNVIHNLKHFLKAENVMFFKESGLDCC